jgi:hypothetical protein
MRDAGAGGRLMRRSAPVEAHLVLVTHNGTILFAGTEATMEGVDALQYMNHGEWHRLPEPPLPGEKVGDGV